MKVLCPYCRGAEVHVCTSCTQCGKFCEKEDVVRPIELLLIQLRECPDCRQRAYDGWKCHKCGTNAPENTKKVQNCLLVSDKEREMVNAYFQAG